LLAITQICPLTLQSPQPPQASTAKRMKTRMSQLLTIATINPSSSAMGLTNNYQHPLIC
jgi:hypothetical protein